MGKRLPFTLCNCTYRHGCKELRLLVAVSLPEDGQGRWVIAFYSWAFGWLWLQGSAPADVGHAPTGGQGQVGIGALAAAGLYGMAAGINRRLNWSLGVCTPLAADLRCVAVVGPCPLARLCLSGRTLASLPTASHERPFSIPPCLVCSKWGNHPLTRAGVGAAVGALLFVLYRHSPDSGGCPFNIFIAFVDFN